MHASSLRRSMHVCNRSHAKAFSFFLTKPCSWLKHADQAVWEALQLVPGAGVHLQHQV